MALTFRQKKSYAMTRLATSDSLDGYSSAEEDEEAETIDFRSNEENNGDNASSPSPKKSNKLKFAMTNVKNGLTKNGVGSKGYVKPSDDTVVDRLVDVEEDEEVLYRRRGIAGGDEDEDEELVLNTNNNNNTVSMEKWDVTRPATCLQSFKDFSNVFKAFIGSNYLGMPYAFAQAGIIAGLFGLALIATLTGHCCHLVVRCKKICVNRLVDAAFASSGPGSVKDASVSETDLLTDVGRRQRLREKAEKNITYGHIGRQAFGRAGEVLVAVALIITQLGFCVNYFIFVGNTIHTLFPSESINASLSSENISLAAFVTTASHAARGRHKRFANFAASSAMVGVAEDETGEGGTWSNSSPTANPSTGSIVSVIPNSSLHESHSPPPPPPFLTTPPPPPRVSMPPSPSPDRLSSEFSSPTHSSPSSPLSGVTVSTTAGRHNRPTTILDSPTLIPSFRYNVSLVASDPPGASTVDSDPVSSIAHLFSSSSSPPGASDLIDKIPEPDDELSSISKRNESGEETVTIRVSVTRAPVVASTVSSDDPAPNGPSNASAGPSSSDPQTPTVKMTGPPFSSAPTVSALAATTVVTSITSSPKDRITTLTKVVTSGAGLVASVTSSASPTTVTSTAASYLSSADSREILPPATPSQMLPAEAATDRRSSTETISTESALTSKIPVSSRSSAAPPLTPIAPSVTSTAASADRDSPTVSPTMPVADLESPSASPAASFAGSSAASFSTSEQPSMISTTANTPQGIARLTSAPPYVLLVLMQVPIQILFSFYRDVRQLGTISWLANIAIFIGFSSLFFFFYADFHGITKDILLVHIKTLPLFIGAVSSAYEGVGTIIPIESSMQGNRHRFRLFLYAAIFLVTLILGSFGISGYLCYGNEVNQIITKNLPSDLHIVKLTSITLCIGIIFTYPLQMFPIIETLEPLFFGSLCCFSSRSNRAYSSDSKIPLLDEDGDLFSTDDGHAKFELAKSISPWKRNLFRALLVFLTSGFAMFLKNYFFYVSALLGSVGSIALAYILPCFFHLCLSRGPGPAMPWSVWVKDVAIILIGVATGALGLYSVIITFLDNPHGFV